MLIQSCVINLLCFLLIQGDIWLKEMSEGLNKNAESESESEDDDDDDNVPSRRTKERKTNQQKRRQKLRKLEVSLIY